VSEPADIAEVLGEPAEPPAETVERAVRREVDAGSLRGLAHPLRVQICDRLGMHGPATATQLAEVLGESSGATSYHLRQLEKYGFVEEDTTRGSGRERFWRRVPGGLQIDSTKFIDSPATRDAAMLVVNEFQRFRLARAEHWRHTFEQWPREWTEHSAEGSFHLKLSSEEMRQLGEELDRVVSAWVDRVGKREAGGGPWRDIDVEMSIFPLGDPPSPTDA
jgi:DNA-binding transcriptional ArsR family regulator